jgi:hypothetical protein
MTDLPIIRGELLLRPPDRTDLSTFVRWKRSAHVSRRAHADVHVMGLLRGVSAADPRPQSWERD